MSRHIRHIRPLAGSITVEVEGDRHVLCLAGDIDSAVVATFKDEHAGELPVVDVMDAEAVTFISSTGLAIMIRCAETAVAAGRERPVLRSASTAMKRVLQLAGWDDALIPPATSTREGRHAGGPADPAD